MAIPKILIVTTLLVLSATTTTAATTKSPTPAPTPAPAPAPAFANLTHLFTVAGPFHTFLQLLQETNVIQTFQNQANNTSQGITIFVPQDTSFSSLKKPSLSNLTSDQLKSLLLFHALPQYYKLSEFTNLSSSSPVTTFAGGQYQLNFTDTSGSITISSGWSNTRLSSSVYSTDPVAVYQVDQVLLPVAIFGVAPPQAPSPPLPPPPPPAVVPEVPPAPGMGPSSHDDTSASSPKGSDTANSVPLRRLGYCMVLAASGALMLLL
ncbi:Fasciclin-like arabinogalactan protein 7 [Acorus gramineus]|uniref:Fasciclin-like arabinogalactan protein 7 n=1 Tax=Acorus gramineus TaxID=55184 RepID=A0AAV9AVR3_ACOGR|nr:Fasciclin-like arabinogalactan protein 7 [Acorus gramineus]